MFETTVLVSGDLKKLVENKIKRCLLWCKKIHICVSEGFSKAFMENIP